MSPRNQQTWRPLLGSIGSVFSVFAEREVDTQAVHDWLEHSLPAAGGDLPSSPSAWARRRKDIAQMVKQAGNYAPGNYAPGPEGLTYLVWRNMGDLAVDVLWEASRELCSPEAIQLLQAAYIDEDALHGHLFNASLLACLLKDPTGETADGVTYYDPIGSAPFVGCEHR